MHVIHINWGERERPHTMNRIGIFHILLSSLFSGVRRPYIVNAVIAAGRMWTHKIFVQLGFFDNQLV